MLNRLISFEQRMDARLNALEQKLEARMIALEQKVDRRFAEMDQRLVTLEISLDRLISMASETKMDVHAMRADLREAGILTTSRR